MDIPPQQCQTCMFCVKSMWWLECHRLPPLNPQGSIYCRWPTVQPDDWCGEWRQK